ncbi:hypothetical protein MLD38_001910 [Melastoma candidum]|uniref:Uncharacterized protein n=1 Tax=Melastoma candidum TaxID=119954 RepID=A0ACB9SGQ8_9MYRT|nr:hypothetical protein MLD38_001910 [Melastoma candidum]
MASTTPSFAAKVPAIVRRRLIRTPISPSTAPSRLPFPRPITFQSIPTKSLQSSPPTSATIESLPSNLQQIVTLFQSSPDPKSKYQQLLFYGQKLSPLDSQYKTPENKVQGCVSQVWVRAYLDGDGMVLFEADSDSVLTKGLAALLVKGLSGCSVEDVLRVSPEFVKLLGLQQSLTPSRNNGFLNMLMLMQKKAAALLLGDDGEERAESAVNLDAAADSLSERLDLEVSNRISKDLDGSRRDDSSESIAEGMIRVRAMGIFGSSDGGDELRGRAKRIHEVLMKELRPVKLEIEDVSYQHAGHAGVRGSGDGETHFNLSIVSDGFEGKSLVKRHRLIYDLLQEELNSGLHALSISAKTPTELDQR